jgi:hypothetical protein
VLTLTRNVVAHGGPEPPSYARGAPFPTARRIFGTPWATTLEPYGSNQFSDPIFNLPRFLLPLYADSDYSIGERS